MMKRLVLTTALFLSAFALEAWAERTGKFQRLNGAQMHAKLAGMEFTDEVHWRDVFGPNGILTGYSMGQKVSGKWSVQKDLLCLDRGKDVGRTCYEVWISGTNMELKPQDSSLPLEGILRRPTGGR